MKEDEYSFQFSFFLLDQKQSRWMKKSSNIRNTNTRTHPARRKISIPTPEVPKKTRYLQKLPRTHNHYGKRSAKRIKDFQFIRAYRVGARRPLIKKVDKIDVWLRE